MYTPSDPLLSAQQRVLDLRLKTDKIRKQASLLEIQVLRSQLDDMHNELGILTTQLNQVQTQRALLRSKVRRFSRGR